MTASGFIDNDIFIKLVACNLLEDVLQVIGFEPHHVGVLASAKYVFKKNRKVAAAYLEEVRLLAIEKLGQFQAVEADHGDETFKRLNSSRLDIDVGEAILISKAVQTKESLLLTGDKRCLAALNTSPDLEDIHKALQGRVLCLEQLIQKLIQSRGFLWIQGSSKQLSIYDITLKIAFGWSVENDEVQVIAALTSYVTSLQVECGGLLIEG
ncbi:MAG TPA: hypothetical protein V6D29_00120 [Leptolyngbyaceae cyanobacterium]